MWLKNTFYPNVPNNVLEIRVDNALACNNFRFSRVQGLVGEIVSDCDQYEKQGCKVINEWWVDANGNRIQVIKNGQPVQQLSGCVEILRDEGQKVWSSVVQTPQSPPQNCNFPPKTCKVINRQSECRQWWQKIREYKCSGRSMPNPNLSNVEKVIFSTNYDPSSGELSWSERQGEKKAFVGTAKGGWEEGSKCLSSEARNCLVKYPTGSRPAYEFLVKECDKSGDSWRCPLSGNEQLVEDCKCASEMKMGFGIATSTLSVIYEALRDRRCE